MNCGDTQRHNWWHVASTHECSRVHNPALLPRQLWLKLICAVEVNPTWWWCDSSLCRGRWATWRMQACARNSRALTNILSEVALLLGFRTHTYIGSTSLHQSSYHSNISKQLCDTAESVKLNYPLPYSNCSYHSTSQQQIQLVFPSHLKLIALIHTWE
jgi:hypothetical protein